MKYGRKLFLCLAIEVLFVVPGLCRADGIYWSTRAAETIGRLDPVNGSASLAIEAFSPTPLGVAADEAAGKLYWIEGDLLLPRILRANLDGTGIEELLREPNSRPLAIALDPVGGKMYWTDGHAEEIRRADLEGSQIETLVTNAGYPSGLALDLQNGTMYWSSHDGSNGDSIRRANLDGSQTSTVVSGLHTPIGIALHAGAGKIYWVDRGNPEDARIQRANLDGSQLETLISAPVEQFLPNHLAVDAVGGRLFWGEQQSQSIQAANLDGTDITNVVAVNYIDGITFLPTSGKLVWGNPAQDRIEQANLDGTDRTDVVVLPAVPLARDIAIDPCGERIYWTDWDRKKLYSSSRDGSETQVLIDCHGAIPTCVYSPVFAAGKLYWIDRYDDQILRSNADGTGVEIIAVDEPSFGRIAVDPVRGRIYWSRSYSPEFTLIRYSGLDGAGPYEFIAVPGIVSKMAVDPLTGRFFYIQNNLLQPYGATMTVSSVSADGAEEMPIPIDWVAIFADQDGLAVDSVHQKVYWTADYPPVIYRADYDGSNREAVHVLTGATPPNDLTFVDSVDAFASPLGSRYLDIQPPCDRLNPLALRLTSLDFPCVQHYVAADGSLVDSPVFQTEWGQLAAHGQGIIPGGPYVLDAQREDGTTALSLSVTAAMWGDVVAPIGVVDFFDIVAIVNRFRGLPVAPPLGAADLLPDVPDGVVNFLDISAGVGAFRGFPYPGQPCP